MESPISSSFLFIPDYDHTIGNLSEELYYILHQARREKKQLRFLRKRLFFHFVFRKIHYQQLKGMFLLESPDMRKPLWVDQIVASVLGFAFSIYVCFQLALHYLHVRRPFGFRVFGVNCTRLFNTEGAANFSTAKSAHLNWSQAYDTPLGVSLPKPLIQSGRRMLESFGIAKDDWFVCLHIRTGQYHRDWNTSDYRNSTPENYRLAIKAIHEAGGKVIRLGDPAPMSINDVVIDYPNSPYKSEIMDLFLIQHCRFYIGTNSGILDTAYLFGVPVLVVNLSDFCLTKPPRSCDRFIFKSIRDKATGKILSLEENFEQAAFVNPNVNAVFLEMFHQHFEIEENSADEILLAVQEMLQDLDRPRGPSEMDQRFNEIFKKAIMRWIERDQAFGLDNAYRFYHRTYANGLPCQFYLRKRLGRKP